MNISFYRRSMGDLFTEINFDAFGEEFQIPPERAKSMPSSPQQKRKLKSVMDSTRSRNVAICARKLPKLANDKNRQDLIHAIDNLDIQVLVYSIG